MRTWRFLLPVLHGLTALGLLSWQAHNSRIIDSMGMAWDTGAPVWPYQTPEIVLCLLNTPAYLIALPAWAAFGLRTQEERAPALLAAVAVLWFGVGCAVDFGLASRPWLRSRKWLYGVFVPISLASVLIAGSLAIEGMGWWLRYGDVSLDSVLIFGRVTGPLPWCVLVAVTATRSVIRNRNIEAQQRSHPPGGRVP